MVYRMIWVSIFRMYHWGIVMPERDVPPIDCVLDNLGMDYKNRFNFRFVFFFEKRFAGDNLIDRQPTQTLDSDVSVTPLSNIIIKCFHSRDLYCVNDQMFAGRPYF